jgi:hypothetical protein
MTDDFTAWIEREAAAGFAAVPGLRLSGAIPIRQDVMTELLRTLPQVPRELQIAIGDGNRVTARAGVLHASAVIERSMELGDSPRIVLTLASAIVAWAVKRMLRVPAIEIEGRRMTIDLGRVPALARHAPLWRPLRQATFTTEAGCLTLMFEWQV